ncbi:helix-turn-helix domain-containing protein [Paenibacillus sp. JDR-2]|uniref:helix-turn-helix domain-containing protein n=1 Tax=Paenibacillus sp. (strain JDR-2) TaxID=324057 RepID=UPI000166B20B|nr:helix-turn-helix domain-containing protein [Paenibacillus sp. JDR-2]ACS99336.1 transcriptional regulator, AraC family [Paenibacillus sp. JDR-2]
MFLKKQLVRKLGKTYTYYRIVTSYVDEQGRRKHRTEKYLGALSEEEAERIRQELQTRKAYRPALPADQSEMTYTFQSIHKFTYAPRAPKEWNVTDTDMVLLVREGAADIHTHARKYSLQAGMALYAPAGCGMHIINGSEQPLVMDRITFLALTPLASGSWTYSRGQAPLQEEGIIHLAAPGRLFGLADELSEAVSSSGPHKTIRASLAFYQWLAALVKLEPTSQHTDAGDWMESSLDYIRDHYWEDLTRDRLASMYGVSPEHFSRLFKRETGYSFTDYLCRIRIRRAQELLQLHPQKMMNEIAFLTGFHSEHYFSRKFKQIIGAAPSVYRSLPKSYAALSAYMTASMLTLGALPTLGVLEPWMKEQFSGSLTMTLVDTPITADPETLDKLASVKPDLILIDKPQKQEELLRAAGPVCVIPDIDEDWRPPLLFLANAISRTSEANAWMAGFERRVAEARQLLAPLLARNETVAIFKIVSDKLYAYGKSTSMGGLLLYTELGLTPPAIVCEQLIRHELPNKEVSSQELSSFAADHIFLFDYRSVWYPDKPASLQSSAWQQLEAVRRGRVYTPNPDIFYGYDPLSLERQLEEALRLLTSQKV